jgi:hypothetical protein
MSPSRYILRHVAYALTFFSVIAFVMEAFMPGSVMPYLDPVPFGVLAVIALGASALYPVRESRPVARSVALIVLALIAGSVALLSFGGSGARSLIAVVLIITALIFSAVMTGSSDRIQK